MRYKVPLIILLFIAACTTGCRGSRETEEVSYITAIGLDKAEQKQVKVSFQIIIPRASSTLQGGGQDSRDVPAILATITASSLAEAFNLLPTTVSRFANRSHMKVFIVSEDLARSGLKDLIAPFVRFREYRGTIFICTPSDTSDRS